MISGIRRLSAKFLEISWRVRLVSSIRASLRNIPRSKSSMRMQIPVPIIRQYAPEVQRSVSDVSMPIWMETSVRMPQVELVPE